MKRVGDNPPSRFPPRPIAEAEHPWWVAKVKPRQEKAFAQDLRERGIEYYLPFYTKVVRRRDTNKPRKSILPLFPGYVSFSQPAPEGIYVRGRVVNIIPVRHQARFIRELSQIYVALEAGAALEPVVESFEPGARVRVRSGPMHGVEGVVAEIRSRRRLVLTVEQFGRASLTVDPALLEALDSPGTNRIS